MLNALEFIHDIPKTIVVVTRDAGRARAEPFLAKLRETYLPNRVLVVVSEGPERAELVRWVPLVEGKTARDAAAAAYVCERGACQLPTTSPDVFARQIATRLR
jgi:uncharacterized protein YyaL (SSP411 family)